MSCRHFWRDLLPSGPNGEWLPTDVRGEICWVCKAVRNSKGRILKRPPADLRRRDV